mgnify:CR=1 FL=1
MDDQHRRIDARIHRLPAARARRGRPAARRRPRRPARRLPRRTHPGTADRPVRRQPGDPVRRATTLALAVRVVRRRHLGVRVRGGPDPGRRAARRRGSGRGGEGGGRDQHRAHRARRRASLRRRQLGVRLRGRPVRRSASPTRSRCWRAGAPACSRHDRDRSRGRLAAPGPGVQVLRRRGHHRAASSGCGCTGGDRGRGGAAAAGSRPCARWPRRPGGAGVPGRQSLDRAPAWDFAAELAELPDLLAGKLAAPSVQAGPLRPGHRPEQPVADHPRVDRPRHRARPGARLRGRLRGHLVRDPGQARQPAVRLAADARHRRPDRRARPGHRRLRRRGRRHPVLGPHRAAACSSATSWTGGWPACGARPVQRLRVRRLPGHMPIQRMANVSLQPAAGGAVDATS